MKTLNMIAGTLVLGTLFISCNKNEFAPDIADQEFSVVENSPAGTVIGKVEASDQDEGQILYFEIVNGNDEGICEINSSDGTLTVSDPTNLDYESITQIILTISVSDEHNKEPLESSATVTIDITNVPELWQRQMSLQPDANSGKDAVFSKIVPDSNYGSLEEIMVYSWTQGGTLNVSRTVMDFDLSDIHSEASITGAWLSLYFDNASAYADAHSGDTDFTIQRIISEWEELSVTWNTQPLYTTENMVLVDGATNPSQNFPEIDITSLIQDYVNDGENSYGLLLRFVHEEPYKNLILGSSDNPDQSIRPKLDIEYTFWE